MQQYSDNAKTIKMSVVADVSKAQEEFRTIEDWKLYKETEEAKWFKNSDGEILSVPKS